MRSSDAIRRTSYLTQGGSLPALKQPSFDAFREHPEVLQKREKIARLLRAFSSPRKRLGLTPECLRKYKVAWVGGCALYDTAKLRAVGGFIFWSALPPEQPPLPLHHSNTPSLHHFRRGPAQ